MIAVRAKVAPVGLCVLLGGWLVLACEDKTPPAPPTRASATAASAVAPRGSAAAPKATAPWFVGTWSGSYTSQHYLIEMERKHGGLRAWQEDKGTLGSGDGQLTLTITEARVVTGSSTGALGALTAAGELDGEVLRVTLKPKDPAADGSFAGTLIAKRAADGFEGRIQASTGDSMTVRDAAVKLTQKSSSGAVPPARGSSR